MPNEIFYWAAINRGASGPFTPSGLSGLVMWLDAQDTSTITTAAGAELISWADKSTNGLTMGELHPGSNPTLSVTGLNGKQAIDYSGANQLSASSFGSAMEFLAGGSDTGYSYFMVYKADTVNSTTGIMSRGRSTNGPYYWIFNPDTILVRNATGGSVFIGIQGTALALTTPLVVGLTYSGSATFNSFEITVNGSASTITLASTSAEAYLNMQADTGNLTFGNQGSGTQFFNGQIGEFIMYNRRLTSAQQTQVTNYLLAQWGL